MKPTREQQAALEALQAALRVATVTGLFDSARVHDQVSPDTINAFCHGVNKLMWDENAARDLRQIVAGQPWHAQTTVIHTDLLRRLFRMEKP